MVNTTIQREAIGIAHDSTAAIISEVRSVVAGLTANGLETTPVAKHLVLALTELQRAKMQAGAFLDIH